MNELGPGLRLKTPEVIYSDGRFRSLGSAVIPALKARASQAPRRRCRLCLHQSEAAVHQAMLIVMHRSSYIRPHRHFAKSETLTVIEGRADAVLFDETGSVIDRTSMSPLSDHGDFFYYMPAGVFHTLVFRSEWLVYVESTIGPFDPKDSQPASWAPSEDDQDAGHSYLAHLEASSRKSKL